MQATIPDLVRPPARGASGRVAPRDLGRQRRRRLVLAAMLLLAGCAADGETLVIKLAHGLDSSHPVHEAMVYMAERVAAKSDSTMRIDIYPSQQLCTERECMELLQIGSLGMTKVSASIMENFSPAYSVLGLPFLFRDEAHRFRVLEGEIGERLLRESASKRLLGLTFYDAGSRSFYTKDRPVRSPEDLRGLKIRVMESATAMRMVRALGGNPTPISWGELYTALQQGVVDGAENNPPSFYTSRHYEVARYYVLNEHTAVPDVLVMSTTIWNTLSEQQRQWLREAAVESAEVQKVLWRKATQEALDAVEAAGVTVLRPDKAPFTRQVAALFESYRDDPVIFPLIEQIRAIESVPAGGETIAYASRTSAASASDLGAQEWRPLFDGRTLDGWRGVGRDTVPIAHWRVEDGTIRKVASGAVPVAPDGQPQEGGDLMTEDTFGNFELAFEWKVAPGANSGIKYNVSEALSTAHPPRHAALGFEYQILDDDRHVDAEIPSHRAGALYDLVVANERKAVRPVGEWNTSRIVFVGNRGEHWLNGELILEYELGSTRMDSLFAASKWSQIPEVIERRRGHIVLQDHNDDVWFRDIRIRELEGEMN